MENLMEENLYIIPDLYNLMRPHMPCDQSKMLAVNYSRAKYADEYGSTILKLNIELVNTTTGEDWTLSALAKTLPRYSIRHDLADIQAIFKKEVGIYTVARPAIKVFLKENGVKDAEDCFVDPLGGRINLNGSGEADHNAALIIRDFKALGYKTVHRRTGFDLETTKAILENFARFHASTIAFKTIKPRDFKEKVRPYLTRYYMPMNHDDIARAHMIEVLKKEGFSPETVERAVGSFDRKCSREIREPWATFVHTNAWVKNVIVKFDRNKRLQNVKFKGFQESEYNSPLKDVLFLLCTSVQLVVLRQHFDELISFYHSNFLTNLGAFNVDTKPFSSSSFNHEIKATVSTGEFYKIVCMMYPILGNNLDGNEDYISDLRDPLHINRLCSIVKEFDERNWLSL